MAAPEPTPQTGKDAKDAPQGPAPSSRYLEPDHNASRYNGLREPASR